MNPNAARTATLGFRPEHQGTKLRETLATGLASLDAVIEGFPRGAISEIIGPESSGRTTLIHSLLAASTSNLEVCAYVDTSRFFRPRIRRRGRNLALPTHLDSLRLKRRPRPQSRRLLLHAGGFGAVILDLCQILPRDANRIPISYWYRFRLAMENTPTILALIEKQPLAKSCASLMLEMKRKKTAWVGAPGFELLREVELEAIPRKPIRPVTAHFKAKSLG